MNPQDGEQNRSRKWFVASLAWHGGTFFLYPALICGCHFHLDGLIVGTLPVAWAGYALLSYSGSAERFLAYTNSIAALGWFYRLWDSNLRFLYR